MKKRSVFISYSCDSKKYITRVKCFIDQLCKDGFTVYCDDEMCLCKQTHCFIGSDLEKYDHILMVCTPRYKESFENQESLAGCNSGSVISKFYQSYSDRFILILLDGSPSMSFPEWVKETEWIDLTDSNIKGPEYRKLVRHLKKGSHSTMTQATKESKIIKIVLSLFMCGFLFFILPISIHQFRVTIALGLLSAFVALLSLAALAINYFRNRAWISKLWSLVLFCTSFLGIFVSFNAIELPIPEIIPGNAGVVRERPETIQISTEEGLEIYYTLDGRDPKNEKRPDVMSDMANSVTVTINNSTNVSARSKFLFFWSDIAEETYTFVKPTINEVKSAYPDAFPDEESYEKNEGEYILWDNKYVFRKYNSNSFVDGSFGWGYASESNPKKICSMYSDGTIEELFEDDGYGPIYLANDRLFMNKFVNNVPHIYSVDILTNDIIEYQEGEIVGMDSNRNFLICKHEQTIYAIDVYSQAVIMEMEASGGILGIRDDSVYYATCKKDGGNNLEEEYVLELKSFSFESYTETNLAALPYEVSDDSFVAMPRIEKAQFCGDDIFLAYGTRAGSLHYYTGFIVRFNLLSKGTEIVAAHSSTSDFLVTNVDGQPYIYYFTDREGISRINVSTRVIESATANTLDENDVFEDETGLCFYGKNNTKHTLINIEEYETYGYETGTINRYVDNKYFSIGEINEFPDKIFFRLDVGYHDPAQDVGWRDYYVRSKTQYYFKEIYSGMNTLIYEVD